MLLILIKYTYGTVLGKYLVFSTCHQAGWIEFIDSTTSPVKIFNNAAYPGTGTPLRSLQFRIDRLSIEFKVYDMVHDV